MTIDPTKNYILYVYRTYSSWQEHKDSVYFVASGSSGSLQDIAGLSLETSASVNGSTLTLSNSNTSGQTTLRFNYDLIKLD